MSKEPISIEDTLREKLGLKSDSINKRQISQALKIRRLACDLPDLKTYVNYLENTPSEWQELIDQIVVPETWFFRHREAFKFLQNFIKTQWLKSPKSSVLKILSIPCSTGEEPYSLGMTLLEAGLKREQFQIDGIDISQKVLQKARQGIYRENSFREDCRREKNRYFDPVPQGYQIHEEVRKTVHFQQANLLEPQGSIHKHYHLIFCRHLLIYLDFTARSHAIDVLEKLLIAPGFLFVGSPETALLKSPRFQGIDYPYAFVYQKGAFSQETTPVKPVEKKPSIRPSLTLPPKKPLVPLESPPNRRSRPPEPAKIPIKTEITLESARRLADQGSFEQAIAICETYLKENPTESQAYLLLGEICQAQGNKQQAEYYFQKVIYLEPNSYEALMHLALLKESQGDVNGANLIKQRIQRLSNFGESSS